MLKKRVLKRLLPLLFSFCCVFSGFLSVDAFAFTVPISSMPIHPDAGATAGIYIYDEFVGDVEIPIVYDYGEFSYEFHTDVDITSVEAFNFSIAPGFNPSFNLEAYDYYLAFNIYFSDPRSYLNVDIVNLFAPKKSASYDEQEFDLLDVRTANGYFNDNDIYDGVVTVVGRIPDEYNSLPISDILLICNGGRIYASQYNEITAFLYQVPKDTSVETVNSLISAINDQTNQLSSDIGQAADDVQQSIEDQYSGEPEEEFSVDDVITQHNEKMGVLSFGSDVMLQFLDMFQSDNVGTAELTLPGFNITVENVDYSVWPDYSFNFEQLNEWVPALMSVIRIMLPAFVWLMVLRYCIKVFEDNFLAK